MVRRILTIHFHPEAGSGGPSWLSFIGHAKDSRWSRDLFRSESAILQSYWALVVMDLSAGSSALLFTAAL
jgi:putative transposase